MEKQNMLVTQNIEILIKYIKRLTSVKLPDRD